MDFEVLRIGQRVVRDDRVTTHVALVAKQVIKEKKADSRKIIHLTMYGENINDLVPSLQKEEKILIVVGAEKVPREIYDFADYNVAVGNQPHSEISALAVLLDRIQKGNQFLTKFENSARKIIPSKKGKNVIMNKTMDK